MTDQTGLRERKKAATQAALSHATLRLAIEKNGIASVTADDIATEAGVSTRTFHNYFSSKEAALLHDFHEITAQLIADVRVRVRTQPVWDALRDAFIGMRIDERFELELLQCKEQLVHSSPSLVTQQVSQFVEFFDEGLDVVAEALGADKTDMYPRLLLGAALVAIRVANEHWIADPEGTTLAGAIAEAFATFEHGVATPTTTPA